MEHWWNDSDRVKPVHVPLLSTTNPAWIGFGSSWNLRDERDWRVSACNGLMRKVARRFDARCYELSPRFNLLAWLHYRKYSRSNFTRSPSSSTSNFSQPRLMSQVGRWAKWCARRSVCFCSQRRCGCEYSPAYAVAAIMRLRLKERKVCETRTEGCNAKWRGLCGCNPAIILWRFHISSYWAYIRILSFAISRQEWKFIS